MKRSRNFLLSLNNATDYSCTVSQYFDFGDLLAIKYLMRTQDIDKLLKLAHTRGWPHQEKWKDMCPVCEAEEEMSLQTLGGHQNKLFLIIKTTYIQLLNL